MNEVVRQLLNFGMADIFNESEASKVESYLVAAGDPASSMTHYDHLIELKDSVRMGRRQFAVCGNSMSPLGIDDGDNILANDFNTNTGDIREGDFLIVKVDPTYYEGERPNYEYKLRCAIMIVEESWTEEMIVNRLKPLEDVGLGYIKLGQNSSTLSGGENQRVKLAYFIGQERQEPSLFIFDEPTTGLHFHDIQRLLHAFDALISRGHTILIIEHNNVPTM